MDKKDITSIYYDNCIYRFRDSRLDKPTWSVLIDQTNNYLTIEALEDDLVVSFSKNTIQYSIDNCKTWIELLKDTTTPTINTGDKISFKATGLVPDSYNGIGRFTVNKKFNLKGNVMSILFGDEGKNSFNLTGYDYAFTGLFIGCTTLRSVSKDFLPATTLAVWCYNTMFAGCSSLVNAPDLPATTMASNCYYSMFKNCTSLVNAPDLPATTLASRCYYEMFAKTNILPDCTNIDFTSESIVASRGLSGLFAGTNVTDKDLYDILPINPSSGKYWLPVTTLTNSCYDGIFYGCTSLVTAPELPATTLVEYCYREMFRDCTSLVTAPELPATTLVSHCYYSMFDNCTSLVTAPELPATTLAERCYDHMFYKCTSLVNTPVLPATILANSCYANMFYSCTSLVTAPELPATTLADNCYTNMFYRCSKLNYIKALFTTEPSTTYTNNWVYGVSSTGTFIKNINATWDVTGVDGIPSGWTVETA